jgi:uncharacterized RDD family membrane protein YckC
MPPDQYIAAQMHMASVYTNAWVAPAPAYGSFLRRLGALFIDAIAVFVLFLIGGFMVGLLGGTDAVDNMSAADQFGTGGSIVSNLILLVFVVGFTAIGGTPGKRIVGLRITNKEGGLPGLAIATIRAWPWIAVVLCNLAYWLAARGANNPDSFILEAASGLAQLVWFVGCFFVLGTKYKQALHDKLAGTYVIRT